MFISGKWPLFAEIIVKNHAGRKYTAGQECDPAL